MKHRKKNVLGLLIAAALGLMAFAASAQAEPFDLESRFFIKGVEVPAGLNAAVEAKQLGRGTLFIPALKTEINCEKFTITAGVITSSKHGEGGLLYEECTVLTNEVGKLEEAFGCKIVSNHTGTGKPHITATALLLPAKLLDGTQAVLAEKIVAKVLTEPEKGCLLPKTTEIKGEVCLKIDKNHTTEPELLASEEIQSLCLPRLTLEGLEVSGTAAELKKLEEEGKGFLDKLLFGVNEAFIEGKADVKLAGAHSGLTLGCLLI